MKHHISLLILLFFLSYNINVSFAQGMYNNGSKIIVPANNYIHVNTGNYTNTTVSSTDGSITLNGTINVDGNWTNNADNELTLSNGTVIFDGSSTQNITGTSFTEFYNLTIASGALVDVPADHFLTVDGTLTMTGTLTLKSDYSTETLTASLLDGGSNSGNLNVELYLTGGVKNHFVSSPVNNAPLTSIFDATNGNYIINWYDEDQSGKTIDNRWVKQTLSLVNARGYTAAYTNNTTRTFTGTLNTSSDITINVTKAGSSTDNGWNLIGNPFPSAVSCSSFQALMAHFTFGMKMEHMQPMILLPGILLAAPSPSTQVMGEKHLEILYQLARHSLLKVLIQDQHLPIQPV